MFPLKVVTIHRTSSAGRSVLAPCQIEEVLRLRLESIGMPILRVMAVAVAMRYLRLGTVFV